MPTCAGSLESNTPLNLSTNLVTYEHDFMNLLRRENRGILALVAINAIPHLRLSYRLVRILIHESGRGTNPYPGPRDPIGPEVMIPWCIPSVFASLVLLLFIKTPALTNSRILDGVAILIGLTIAHAIAYCMFIIFGFGASGATAGRSV